MEVPQEYSIMMEKQVKEIVIEKSKAYKSDSDDRIDSFRILNPVRKKKVESLDKMGDQYQLKALWKVDPRKESLYKSVQQAAELKSDYICITETNDEPWYLETENAIKQTAEDNESIGDILQFEHFKWWVKENGIALGGVMIGIAGIITTISISVRNFFKDGARATEKLAKAEWN